MVLVAISVGCLVGLFSGTPAVAEDGPSKKAHQEVYEKPGLGNPVIIGVSQTCLGANVLSGLVPCTVFKKNLWAFLGPCVRGRGGLLVRYL